LQKRKFLSLKKNIPFPDWFGKQKAELTENGTLPFGQLPRLQNGDLAIVQSNAISRYLARKLNLYGNSIAEHSLVDTWLDYTEDVRVRLFKTIYVDKASEASKAEYLPFGEKNAALMEAQLLRVNEGKGYLAGPSVTVADFSLWELVDVQKGLFPELLPKFPTLAAWHARVAARPNIAAYVAAGKRHA